MASLKSAEMEALQALREVAATYQNYEENFNDVKYAEIREYFINPLLAKAGALMTAFTECNAAVRKLSEEGIMTEN